MEGNPTSGLGWIGDNESKYKNVKNKNKKKKN